MAKKIFTISSLLIITSMLLAACGGAAPTATAASEPEVLRVWIQWGDNPQQLQSLFDKYTAETGIKVEVTAPLEEDKILPSLTGSEPPDVLVLSGPDLVKSYAKEGLVTELSDIIKTGGIDLDDFFPAPLKPCEDGDLILCLPWGTDMYALFWNKDMFEAAGLDPEVPPQTMEELAEFADKLTKTDADGNVTQVGFLPDQGWDHSDLYARMFGGFWYSEDGQHVTANSQAMIDQLTWQQQFYQKYGGDKVLALSSGWADQYMSADYPFYTGKMAMYVDGEWMTGPNFISAFKPEASYGVAPFPPPADHPERANTGVVQGTVAVIPAGAKNKDASAKLLAWMMSPEIVAEEFCFNANLPTSRKAAEDKCFTENPKFKVFMDLMASPNASHIITTPISLEFNDAYSVVLERAVHNGEDPKTLLDELQEEFEPKLQEALK
jgi:multiple sugar transport system substrate-binding protein